MDLNLEPALPQSILDVEVIAMRPRNKILSELAGQPGHQLAEVMLDIRDALVDVKAHLAQIQVRQEKALEKLDEVYHELPPRSDVDEALKGMRELCGDILADADSPGLAALSSTFLRDLDGH